MPPRPPTRADVYLRLRDLVEGTLSCDDAEEWARPWIAAEDSGIEDEVVWAALTSLAGASTKTGPSERLYGLEDYRAWLQTFEERVGEQLPRVRMDAETGTSLLHRPTGEAELELVADGSYMRWPPQPPDQPIFNAVLTEDHARAIASRWEAREGRRGYVTRFRVRREFLRRYDVHRVGSRTDREYRIPAEDLDDLNDNIVGRIEVVAEYQG